MLPKPNTLCDLEAERMFTEAFPALRLTGFIACRKDDGYTANDHIVCVHGSAHDLVRSGLIASDLMLPGRKRVATHWLGADCKSTSIDLRRRRRGVLDVVFRIADDESLPPSHPLQMFHPQRWPFGDRRAQRTYFDQYREIHSGAVEGLLLALEHVAAAINHGYKIHPGDTAHMQQLVAEFGIKFRHAFATARVVAEQAPQLKLAVNRKTT
jgi:hypothetical protein